MSDCVFCRIVAGEIPSKKVLETEDILVFHDLHPSTKYHVLIVPKKHIKNFEDISERDKNILYKMVEAGQQVIKEQSPKKYRLILNGGSYLEVDHLHWHLQIGNLTKNAIKSITEQ